MAARAEWGRSAVNLLEQIRDGMPNEDDARLLDAKIAEFENYVSRTERPLPKPVRVHFRKSMRRI